MKWLALHARTSLVATVAAVCGVCAVSAAPAPTPAAPGAVDDARLLAADADPNGWITHGRDYAEQRFSPLAQVDDGNVARLVRVWSFETGLKRGHEATPLVVDGVMYLTGPWSVVFAL